MSVTKVDFQQLGQGTPQSVPTATGTPANTLNVVDGTPSAPQATDIKASAIFQRVNALPSNIATAFVFDGSSTNAANPDQGIITLASVIHDQTVARGGTAARATVNASVPVASATVTSATISGSDVIVITATAHYAHLGNAVRFSGTSGISSFNVRQIVTAIDSDTQFRVAKGSFSGGPATGGTVYVQTAYFAAWHSVFRYYADQRIVGLESDYNNLWADAPNDTGEQDATFNAAFYATGHKCTVGLYLDSGDAGVAGKWYFPLKFGANAVVDNYPFIDTSSRLTGNCDFAWIGNNQSIRWADSGAGRWPIMFLSGADDFFISAPTGHVIQLGPNLANILQIAAARISAAKPVVHAPVAFSALPAASTMEGALASVTDSNTATWGATITGGGSNHVLAFSNGVNWTVAGK